MSQRKVLQFFPGPHVMVWVVDGRAAVRAAAWGGEEPVAGFRYDVMKPRKTTAGRYVIYSCEPYRTRTWSFSKLTWGTRLRVEVGSNEVLYETGVMSRRWRRVSELIPGLTKRAVQEHYYSLYGDSRKYDPDGDYIPDQWVFNDFGAWAVRYFRDRNGNRKLDGGEALSGEMIHTTPENEAQVAKGEAVTLGPSHGCIHLNPIDRDKLKKVGAFERGTDLIVHSYDDAVPASLK